ncbi:MAG: nucleotidyltransferase domain-containing protein [Chloroflexota bacterium]|nr:nucleotidyltransferase domain-containing protein [Chloroflexota bacterium]
MNSINRQRLSDIFSQFPEIEAVYLFGSHATGKTHAESDLDLAIVPRDEQARTRKLDILTELARHGFCDVDLVILDSDDIVLEYEAVRYNQLIYQTENFDRGTIYSLVVRKYLDFLPYLKVQREAYKRRILSGKQRNHPQKTE